MGRPEVPPMKHVPWASAQAETGPVVLMGEGYIVGKGERTTAWLDAQRYLKGPINVASLGSPSPCQTAVSYLFVNCGFLLLGLTPISDLQMAATLVNAYITFHTNDDDKDHDTNVLITIKESSGRTVARLQSDFERFPDRSTKGPYLMPILHPSTEESLRRGTVMIQIRPIGHDTWKFDWILKLVFDDGSNIINEVDGITLDQENTKQIWGFESIVPRV
ncbi:hypothetical protein QFC21_007134 [Naganishia friedmannii]|uniref:Uncharacterized protein n=1 Tax=Naganishia friedmannii TaxID=89922 RepID=A0ACC2UX64_9TREE|nr:hypothetical protein QFC21_007134 [Naganishia friedmannii]